MRAYPKLDALLESNPALLAEIETVDEYGMMISAAEALIVDADELGVRGVDKLRQSGGAAKFRCLLSELRVANMFARLGLSVEVLPDEAFGRGDICYTPDLLVRREDGLAILVDVVYGSHGHPDISGPLDRALKREDLSHRLATKDMRPEV